MPRTSCVHLVPGSVCYRVLELIKQRRRTSRSIVDVLKIDRRHVSYVISTLRRAGRIHIAYYKRVPTCKTQQISAVFAYGYGIDAKRPATLTHAERNRLFRAKRKIPKVPNSVFQLGSM